MKLLRNPLSVWLSLVAMAASILIVIAFTAHLLQYAWPPQVVCKAEECKEAREWIARSVTFLVLIGGLYQYWRSQLWKRAEFVAAQMATFFGLPNVRKARTMIDWAKRRINLYDEEPAESEKWPLVTRRLQSRALLPHTVVKGVLKIQAKPAPGEIVVESASPATDSDLAEFTRAEAAIRDAYDSFFDGIETFASYIRTGLVAPSDLRPYLGYWIDDIASQTDDPDDDLWTCSILSYIEFYGYKGIQDLFGAYGKNIRPGGDVFNHFLRRAGNDDIGKVLNTLWESTIRL